MQNCSQYVYISKICNINYFCDIFTFCSWRQQDYPEKKHHLGLMDRSCDIYLHHSGLMGRSCDNRLHHSWLMGRSCDNCLHQSGLNGRSYANCLDPSGQWVDHVIIVYILQGNG